MALSDTATSKSAGISNHSTGTITSDGTAITVTVGFLPRRVELWNETDAIYWLWMEGMAATKSMKLDSAAAADTGTAITATGKTFVISSTAAGTSKALCWAAWG